MELTESRKAIESIDEQMAILFVQRMEAVREIAAYKFERDLPVEDRQQEERILQRQGSLIEDDELRSFYMQFLQSTMDVSKRWQHRLIEGWTHSQSRTVQ